MEFVRSCYVGQWRLFRDHPEQLTTGRYVRAPEGTPFYQGWHNFWSSNWTADAQTPPETPTLGEVTTGNRPWSNGAYRYPYAPAVPLGNPACLDSGDAFPVPLIERQMFDGFDSRCWTSQGLVPPDPLPVLKLLPEALAGYAIGEPIGLWEDASGLKNPLSQPDSLIAPIKDNDGTFDYATFDNGVSMVLKRTIELCDTWEVWLVVNVAGNPSVAFQNAALSFPSLTLRPTRWDYQFGSDLCFFNIGGGASGLMLCVMRRRYNSVRVTKNTTPGNPLAAFSTLHKMLGTFTAAALFRGILPPRPFIFLPVPVYECHVFDTWQTDQQYAATLAYFTGKYGL